MRGLLPIVLSVLLCPLVSFARPPQKHVVKSGESIAKIADHYGVAQTDLCSQNGLMAGKPLAIGSTLIIPIGLRAGGKGHIVKSGDTLSSLAKKYKTTVAALARANKLRPSSPLSLGKTLVIPPKKPQKKRPAANGQKSPRKSKMATSGKKVKGGVRHTIQRGQPLWIIARAYNVSIETILTANELQPDTPLQAGQTIFIPGAKAPVPVRTKGFVYPSVNFTRLKTGQTEQLRLLTRQGKVSRRAVRRLSQLAGPLGKKSRRHLKWFHPRLIHMLERVIERFPDRSVTVISGYRPGQTSRESRHTLGQAIDFRIEGVNNRTLYEFCTQLPKCGCGYYPNSVFVHMDVRQKSGTWTDYSKPGEKARYVAPSTTQTAQAEK